tara:strand:- start:40 stop:672 length:633 start_codon:yes stop_codon:yes gene_type:complete
MFPLGTVLFPSGVLPLRVFEPRYRDMLEDLLSGNREFGVVLIERGSEVGGGEVRSGIGTMARILEARKSGGGHWSVVAMGLQRIMVDRWLPDDPYPMAEVRPFSDRPGPGVDPASYAALRDRLHRLLEGLVVLGETVPSDRVEIAEDPALGSLQMAALAPLTPFDRQRILEVDRVEDRCRLLGDLLGEGQELVDLRLRAGEGGAAPGPSR